MKISIITVCYNSSSTIKDTFESVLNQSYADYEYIVVDGLSSDGTVDIIKEYQPRFQGKMRWISEKDSGLYDAMNKGIRMATGDVVGILNSDDFFTSGNVLESVNRGFDSPDTDAIYADVRYVKQDDLQRIVRHYSSKHFRRWKMRCGLIPAHPSFYARKELFEKFGFYRTDYRIAADFELLLRFIFVNRINTLYIPETFVTMRMGGVSTNSFKVHFQIMKEHLKAFKQNNRYTNPFFLHLRYGGKIYDLIKARLSNIFR